jgi:sugar (pentulose or hexulose) kinase
VRTRSVGADGVEADPEELFESVVAASRRALAAARGARAHAVALTRSRLLMQAQADLLQVPVLV